VKKTTFFRYVLDLYFAERALIVNAHSITCRKLLTKQIVSNLAMVLAQKKTVLILMDKLLNFPRERGLKIDWSLYSIRQPFQSKPQSLGIWSRYYTMQGQYSKAKQNSIAYELVLWYSPFFFSFLITGKRIMKVIMLAKRKNIWEYYFSETIRTIQSVSIKELIRN